MEILKHNRVGSEKVKYNWVCLNESGVIELSNWIALSTGPLPKEEACSQRDTSQLGLKLSQDIFFTNKEIAKYNDKLEDHITEVTCSH